MRRVTAVAGDSVALLCWRHLGRTDGAVEAVLIANPGLAEYGALLPAGLTILLPAAQGTKKQTLIQIWE